MPALASALGHASAIGQTAELLEELLDFWGKIVHLAGLAGSAAFNVGAFSGRAPAGRLVHLQRLDAGTRRWRQIATARADATGAFVAHWRPDHIGATSLRAILHTTAVLFQAIKFAGVAYLLWMAWATLRRGGSLDLQARAETGSAGRIVWRGSVDGFRSDPSIIERHLHVDAGDVLERGVFLLHVMQDIEVDCTAFA